MRPVYKKASRVQEMVETIRGEKENMGYTAQETSDVQAAWREANSVDREYKSTLESPFANKRPKKLYDDRRQAVIANVRGGTGPIITLRRGDLGVSADVLKVKNKNHNPRFVFHQGQKFLMPKEDWPTSNKFWIYQFGAPYDVLVTNLKAHSAFAGWDVKDMGLQSMDFLAPDRQIYDFIKKQVAKGAIDLDAHDSADFFSAHRGVPCLRSWIETKDAEYSGLSTAHSREW